MGKKIGLLVGLNRVSGGDSPCDGCEADVDRMRTLLIQEGFDVRELRGPEATADAVLAHLDEIAAGFDDRDLLVFHVSSHGSQRLDGGWLLGEDDGSDETIRLYDRELVDDELAERWMRFPGGLVFMLSDGCSSGTNHFMRAGAASPSDRPTRLVNDTPRPLRGLRAGIIHFGSSQDGQTARSRPEGGLFIEALQRAWTEDQTLSYIDLFGRASAVLAAYGEPQHPQLSLLGSVTPAYAAQTRAFTR